MFYDQMRILDCDLCEYGFMIYDEQATIDNYTESYVFQSKDLNKIAEKIINEYLVFKCFGCGSKKKYTYKQIEKLIREDVTKKVIRAIQTDQALKVLPKMGKRGYMIYCGKCEGFDGNGCCPSQIYENCEIKKFNNM